MKYAYSSQDKRLRKRFKADNSQATLAEVDILRGNLRGLGRCALEFKYPISAICGRNGSGKSTLLALAACAFHSQGPYNPLQRKRSYYTFSDFFIQTRDEVPPAGIEIAYGIQFDRWDDDEPGLGYQLARKKRGGRWTNYDLRVDRCVAYFGIERVVPHFERSVSRSYKGSFRDLVTHGWEETVRQHVGRILDLDYDSYWLRGHRRHRMPMIVRGKQTVSGFNMGAGESALFAIFEALYSAPSSLLLVVDEIELGLHEQAQRKFIAELKGLCESRSLQVVCTTHSPAILDALPPEGRFFLERSGKKTRITPSISPSFAAGRLGAKGSAEIDILVEDDSAAALLSCVLDHEMRVRTNIVPVGSAPATIRTLGSRFVSDRHRIEHIAVLDGDQRSVARHHKKKFLAAVETSSLIEEAKKWVSGRILFLPGLTSPEAWLIAQCSNQATLLALSKRLRIDEDSLADVLKRASRAGGHSQFYELSVTLAQPVATVRECVVGTVAETHEDAFTPLRAAIRKLLH